MYQLCCVAISKEERELEQLFYILHNMDYSSGSGIFDFDGNSKIRSIFTYLTLNLNANSAWKRAFQEAAPRVQSLTNVPWLSSYGDMQFWGTIFK